MENKTMISSISGENGSNIVARLRKETWYKFKFKIRGDFRLQFFVTDEDTARRLFVINRYPLVTTGNYEYSFRPSENSILEYAMKYEGEVYDIELYELDKEAHA